MNKLSELSVFFPAFNEAENIEKVLKEAVSVLPEIAKKYEIIVVNDGSTDATGIIAERFARTNKNVRVITQDNKGYGGALKTGFASARYNWVFFTDADRQFRIADICEFLPYTDRYDILIGYRKIRAEGELRAYIAFALKIWNRILLSFPADIRDIDCAFKLINRSALNKIGGLYSDGAMISTEMLLKAAGAGLPIKQIEVAHYPRYAGNPTGNSLVVIARAIRETFYLRERLGISLPLFGNIARRVKSLIEDLEKTSYPVGLAK